MDQSRALDLLHLTSLKLRFNRESKGKQATKKPTREGLLQAFCWTDFPRDPLRTSYINWAYPPSTTPLSDLRPISISELRLETHHVGRVLVVRTFGLPLRMQSVQNAVEDQNFDVDTLQVYDASPHLAGIHVLPKDAIFAIKEPFYKISHTGGYMIRVDHPSDLHHLEPSHPMVPHQLAPRVIEAGENALGYKNIGNAAFKIKDFLPALTAYTKGVEACTDNDDALKRDLYRNRSIVNTYLGRYEYAARDAIAALISDVGEDEKKIKDNVKALYRAGRAFYFLQNFSEAQRQFEQLLKIQPDDKDGLEQLSKTKTRVREATMGEFDFISISNSVSSTNKRLDHASFTANVAVQDAGEKGRGLSATKDIKAGDLVLVEKAFAVVFGSEVGNEEHHIMNMNRNSIRSGGGAILLYHVLQKMRHNATQAQQVLELFDGGYSQESGVTQEGGVQIVDGAVVIDTMKVAAITEVNCFGCEDPAAADAQYKTPTSSQGPPVSLGLWIVASYFNNACTANVNRIIIGDCMILRAVKDIAKDDELLITYHDLSYDVAEKQERLQRTWKFQCGCNICIAEGNTPADLYKERQKLIQLTQAFLEDHPSPGRSRPDKGTIAKAQKLHDELDAAYDKTTFKNVPRLALARFGKWLGVAYGETSPKKSTDAFHKVLTDLGYGVEVQAATQTLQIDYTHCLLDEVVVDVAVSLALACVQHGKMALFRQYVVFAKERYQTMHGSTKDFTETYGV